MPFGHKRRGYKIETTEGSNHTKVRFDDRRSIVPRHASDLKTGTFRAVLKQLGLTEDDLEI